MILTNRKVSQPVKVTIVPMLAVLIALLSCQCSFAQLLDSSSWVAGTEDIDGLPDEGSLEYEFSETDLAAIVSRLKYVGVKPPFDLAGSVSGSMWLRQSDKGLFDWSGYRVELQLRSPELAVNQWVFRNSILQLGYAEGIWHVGKLRGQLSSATQSDLPIGQFQLNARLPVGQNSDQFSIGGNVRQFSIRQLLAAFGSDINVQASDGTADFSFSAPVAGNGTLDSWAGVAKAKIEGLQWAGLQNCNVNTAVVINAGIWRTESLNLTVANTNVEASASGSLETQLPYKLILRPVDLDCERVLAQFGLLEASANLKGQVRIAGEFEGDTSGVAKIDASFTSNDINFAGLGISRLKAKLLANRETSGLLPTKISLDLLEVAGGKVRGHVGWGSLGSISGQLPRDLKVSLAGLDLGKATESFVAFPCLGVASGEIEFHKDAVRDFELSSNLQVVDASLAGSRLGTVAVSFGKRLKEPRLLGKISDAANTINAAWEVSMSDRRMADGLLGFDAYRATGKLTGFESLSPKIAGLEALPVRLTGAFSIAGDRSNWLQTGDAHLSKVTAIIGGQQMQLNDAFLTIEPHSFVLNRFHLYDTSGKIVGSARLQRHGVGEHLVQLKVSGVEVGPYLRTYAVGPLKQVAARLEGTVVATAAADEPVRIDRWNGSVQAQLNTAKYRGITVGSLETNGWFKEGEFQSKLAGNLLSGEMNLRASGKFGGNQSKSLETLDFDGEIQNTQLEKLIAAVAGARVGARYRGLADCTFEGGIREENTRVTCSIDVPRLMRDREVLARDLSAKAELDRQLLRILELNGAVAGGRLRCEGVVESALTRNRNVDLLVSADQLSLDALLGTISAQKLEGTKGKVSYRGRLRGFQSWDFDGTARLRDGELFSIPVEDIRSHIHCDIGGKGIESVTANDIHGDFLGGKVDAELKLRIGARVEAESTFKLRNGRLEELSRAIGFNHIGGRGEFNAQARLRSRDVQNLSALSGPFRIDFDRGDSQSLPLIADMGRIIPFAQFASTKITGGNVEGRFGQGYATISSLLVNSKSYWLAASGRAALASQKLDFDAVVNTGSGLDATVGQALSSELLLAIAPQLALLNEIGEVVNNRTVYIEVLGTAKHPVIRLQAAQTVAKAFLQNLQRELLVSPSVDFGNN